MQWSNGCKFVQFTVLQMLCNFERLKFVLIRDTIIRRHRPFNLCNRLTQPYNEKAERSEEGQELLIQRLTFMLNFTGKHLLHCKSYMHIRLFLCPEYTNANAKFLIQKKPSELLLFFSSLYWGWEVQGGRLPGSLKCLTATQMLWSISGP